MTFLQRLRNLWRISGQEITKIGITEDGRPFHAFGEPTIEKPGMAQIIKRKSQEDIINEVLSEK